LPRRAQRTPSLPTREALLDFLRESPGRVGKREIARAFGVKGADRVALKALLRDLAEEGAVEKRRARGFAAAGALEEYIVAEVTAIDEAGEAWAEPADWRGEGAAPRILLLPDTTRGRAPGLKDRALVRLRRAPDGGWLGHVIRRLPRAEGHLVGVLRAAPGGARIAPTNRRLGGDFAVTGTGPSARPGDLVLAEPLPSRRQGLPEARVVENLGSPDQPRAASLIAIHSHGLPTVFAPEALAEATRARPVTSLGHRTDLRGTPLVTIDDEDARDFDDAVWAEPDADPANAGGWTALVAIADVAHYVRAGTALDRDARERGNSAYFPDRVVPMLPEALSNELCSLKPAEDRPCLAVRMTIAADGRLARHRFVRGLMRSAARLTYRQIQGLRDKDGSPESLPVASLYGVFETLRRAREARGALDIDMPERRVHLDQDGRVTAILPRPHFDSHRLVEELMIAANVAAAETLERHRRTAIYRVHDQPAQAKIEALRDMLEGFGLRLRRGQRLEARDFNGILAAVEGKPYAATIHEGILRSQAQAEYSPTNIGHFGLALGRYCHFTSPIRRYADLMVHRALIAALGFGKDGPNEAELAAYAATALHVSSTERRADRAERDAVDRYLVGFLADQVGAAFGARITGVGRFGVFVRLEESGAEGLVPASRLHGGPFRADDGGLVLHGRGVTFRVGDPMTVELVEIDPVTASLRFDPVEKGRSGPARQRRGDRRR
jgi:ribonuclease R